ncbi:MAG TPA: hypothetical protein ENK14_12605 [Caldithrix sp.]|nr:hypothetical protein [Caldithrix sp.]
MEKLTVQIFNGGLTMKFKILKVPIGILFLGLLLLFACEEPEQPTYDANHPDPNPTGFQPAKIDSLSPGEGFLKDVVQIYGKRFNTEPQFNFVAFGSKVAEVLSASENMLEVRAPNISGETVKVKIGVKGSEFWSNETDFVFFDALSTIDEEILWPMGVAVDDSDNVYIGSAGDEVIYKITPDGTKSQFAAVPVSGAIEFGPGNYLYVCEQGEGKIVRISPDGTTVEDVVTVDSPIDFDWDANGDMYIVSNWIGINRFDTGGGLTQVASIDNGKCLRIFESNLYVSDIWNGVIKKYDITANGLENEEDIYEGDSPLGIEFDAEGTMYFTEAWETSLYTMKPDGTQEVLYEGQLMTPMHYLTFYKKKMYIVYPGWGDVGQTMSAYIGVEQAPNYGRSQ